MDPDIPFEKMIQAAMRHGAELAEVFWEETRRTTITCDGGRIEQAASSNDSGVGFKAMLNGRTVFASTNDLTKKALMNLARQTAKALMAKRRPASPVNLVEKKAPSITTVKMHPLGISLEKKCGIVIASNDMAWKAGKAIKQVRIVYRDAVRRVQVAASDGTLASDEQVDTVFMAQVVAGNEGLLQTGVETVAGSVGFELFGEMPPEEIAAKAAARAIMMLSARPAPAGTMPVIISSVAGGTMIHEAVGHGLEADIASEGLSVYSGKMGERVGSDIVTVVDDATLRGKRGSFTFDDEGTSAKRTVLIENGILKAYLSNRSTAAKMGTPSTGNGRRQSFENPAIVRMTNTLIAPGKDEPGDILKGTPSGLFVCKMGGGQVNTINGDFVFEVQEGYLIEGGKLGEPVRGATLIGNGPKILMAIDRVGKDLGFSVGTCGKDGQETPVSCGQPTIRIPEMVVGGTAR